MEELEIYIIGIMLLCLNESSFPSRNLDEETPRIKLMVYLASYDKRNNRGEGHKRASSTGYGRAWLLTQDLNSPRYEFTQTWDDDDGLEVTTSHLIYRY
ncbi:uncharacterized protein RSE6_00440 [Rhynchosporium secalis]|uniref:Uncharacterized protein n=1 Tax=Rhynchosporium secalis TaxID=38038 RepID=A0A1E1LV84_RHYSE|nr:uncharacterized protein RSE6_00440 [Rhynchosporium secalis]